MAFYRADIGFQMDSAFPRDAIHITPHFGGDNPQALANALKTNLMGKTEVGPTVPFKIRIYDAEAPPPSYPLAEALNDVAPKVTGNPRELALCLSYYSTWNRPRYRGRIYIPSCFISGNVVTRPTGAQITQALSWRTVFSTGLPAAHNWILYSPTSGDGYGVTNCWVDDEWDVIRSRGLKGTTRQSATVP